MDSVRAILTVPGYKASQGEQASRVSPGGWWRRPELEQAPGFESEPAAGTAGTAWQANMADRAAGLRESEPELALGPTLQSVLVAL